MGPSIAADLRALGIEDPTGLRGEDPERLYARSNTLRGVVQDRCLLYVFRSAVYFANTSRHQPELLKWWMAQLACGTGRSVLRLAGCVPARLLSNQGAALRPEVEH